LLGEWPLPKPSDWIEQVNLPQTDSELEAIRRCLHRGSPYGNATWSDQIAEQLGLKSTLRGRGRPRQNTL
jgi:putative transposase